MIKPRVSWDVFARQTSDALTLLTAHDDLLGSRWRDWVQAARIGVRDAQGDPTGAILLRSARMTAYVAARAAAQAAESELYLLRLSDTQLDDVQAQWEHGIQLALAARSTAAGRLDGLVEQLVLTARHPSSASQSVGEDPDRCPRHLAEKLGEAMRAYDSRIEDVLSDLVHTVGAAVGGPTGDLLPGRSCDILPAFNLRRVTAWGSDESRTPAAHVLREAVGEYRDSLAHDVDAVAANLRARMERVRRCRRDGERQVEARILALSRTAHMLSALAEALDWMLMV